MYKNSPDVLNANQTATIDEKPSILYLDDEEDNLVVFKSSFRRHFKVFTAMSGDEGLRILREEDIAVVITDQRMPKMSGIQFLKSIPKDKDPIRIILTGYTDKDSIIDCINNGMVHKYILKPWSKDDLKSKIDDAVSLYQLKQASQQLVIDLKESNHLLEQKIAKRTLELDIQKAETERLLLNVLPSKVADEMKSTGKIDPKFYDSTTVLIAELTLSTDFKDEHLLQDMVAELNRCFIAFDSIIEKHNLEKIKTSDTSYLCVGGIPTPNSTHAVDSILAAMELKSYIASLNTQREANGLAPWILRVGVHTGPLTTGVVGLKKFTYDVWGSTLTIANHLLASCENDKVNISENTFSIVKDWFSCLYYGKTSSGNLGEVDMYYVEEQIH